MRHIFRKNIIANALRHIAGLALLMPAIVTMTSCDSLIYDDLEPCDSGVILRFVYDYNMEYANSFHSKVDNLTVLLYDIDGNYIDTYYADKQQISDEDYRLKLDLPPGAYHLAAYGGINSSRSQFVFEQDPSKIQMTQRRLRLMPNEDDASVIECSEYLRPMFYGASILVVPQPSESGHVYETVRMMKNTNSFRIVLQQINGQPLSQDDFVYEIVDDNILFNYDNGLMPTHGITYMPWAQGDVSVGTNTAGEPWITTYAEMSTSRLIDRNSVDEPQSRAINGSAPGVSSVSDPRMRISLRNNGRRVLDIPLIKYLELYKSEVYADMPLQEFLDRQNSWDIIFFLDQSQNWISAYIQVNGWTVRINDIDT